MSLSPPSMTVPFFESTWYVIFFPPVCQNLRHCDSHVFFSFPFCLLCATPQGPLVVVTLQSFHQHLSGRIYCAVITAHSCLKCTKFNSGALYTEIMMILSQVQARLPRPIQYVLTEFGQIIFNMRYTVQVHHKNRSSDWIAAEWLFVNLFNF